MVLLVGSGKNIVGAVALIFGIETGIENGGQRLQFFHFWRELTLQIIVKNLCLVHSDSEVVFADVPATDDEIIGVDHGKDRIEWDVYIFVAQGGADANSRRVNERAEVIGLLNALSRIPLKIVLVGENSSSDSGAIIAAPTDHHGTDAADLLGGSEGVVFISERDGGFTIACDVHNGASIVEIGLVEMGGVANMGRR